MAHRKAYCLTGWMAAAAMGLCATPLLGQTPALTGNVTASAAKGPGSLSGVWLKAAFRAQTLASGKTSERDKVQRTVDGEWPPLQPQASAELERRIQRSEEGDPIPTTLVRCLPGMPVMLLASGAYPVQILESPGQVTMLFEEMNYFRVIHLNSAQPKDPDPAYMGHSVGRWEGDTLVVDTIGLMENTPLDWLGTPHSDQLHLTERYRRTGEDTLELMLTIDDPKTFTRPWDVKQLFKAAPPDRTLTEYICENNRDDRR